MKYVMRFVFWARFGIVKLICGDWCVAINTHVRGGFKTPPGRNAYLSGNRIYHHQEIA